MERLIKDNILFYDSDCGLCQRSVQILLKLDKKNKLNYAPLNGDTAKNVKQVFSDPWPDSLAFYNNKKLYFKSRSVAKALSFIGWPSNVASYSIFLTPTIFADWIYDNIAKNRQKWFSPSCILVSEETKNRFLP